MIVEGQDKVPVKDMLKDGSSNERSTIEFPYTDLDNAIEIAQGVHAVGGTTCDYNQLASYLSQEAKGGGFRMRIIGARTYGLITYERGGRITLTELGRRMTDLQMERAARAEAFLEVELFSKVFENLKGSPLPPQAGLSRAIIGFGVGPKVAEKARQVLMRSAKQAGYFELKPDRLTAPPIRDNSSSFDKSPPHNEKNGRGVGGAGGDSDDYHPLIQGLLVTLPKVQTSWPTVDRMNWLMMANSIFKTLFPPQDGGEIEIALKESKQ